MHSEEFEEACLLEHSGELAKEKVEALEDHRQDCARCAELSQALWTGDRLASQAAASLPEAALERIAAAVLRRAPEAAAEEEARQRRPAISFRFPFPRALLAAGTIAASLLVALYVSREAGAPQPELAWSNGIEESVDGLSGELDELSGQLADSADEIDSELRGLENAAEAVTEQLR